MLTVTDMTAPPRPKHWLRALPVRAATLAVLAVACLVVPGRGQPAAATESTTPTPASSPTTLPVRHHEPTTWEDWVDCTPGLTKRVRGERLTVRGHPGRPTVLQRAEAVDAPLVVMLHGANGCIEKLQSQTDIEEIGPAWGVSLLWLSGKQLGGRWWNVNGRCCGKASDAGVDDYAYVRAALRTVRKLGLNPRRVVVVGKSNGGGMAVGVGCLLWREVDVVVSASGFKGSSCRNTGVSLVALGGTADAKLGAVEAGRITTFWRNGPLSCSGRSRTERRGTAVIETWKCRDGRFVRLVVLRGMDHFWPTWSYFSADEEVLRIARGETP
jgi:poly(3-hydroxybutyrate) depolymerase